MALRAVSTSGGGGASFPGTSVNPQVLYNNAGAIGGIANATSDGTNLILGSTTVDGGTTANSVAFRNGTNGQKLLLFKTQVTPGSNYQDIVLDASGMALTVDGAGASDTAVNFTFNGVPALTWVFKGGTADGGSTIMTLKGSDTTVNANGPIIGAANIYAQNGTAIPAGGTAGAGFKFSSTANFGVFFGSGAPSLAAAKGSLYLRSDGSGIADRIFVNTNGSTTWTNLVTAA